MKTLTLSVPSRSLFLAFLNREDFIYLPIYLKDLKEVCHTESGQGDHVHKATDNRTVGFTIPH